MCDEENWRGVSTNELTATGECRENFGRVLFIFDAETAEKERERERSVSPQGVIS